MKKVLLVGGAGPTGPHLANGIVDRGHELVIFHRGVHEPPGLPDVEHIHADPHFLETIQSALQGRQFDMVIATYGRIRHIAETVAGRCEHFISVGGMPAYLGMLTPEKLQPFGARIPQREDDDVAAAPVDDGDAKASFSHKVWMTENQIMQFGEAGAFNATHFRYPRIYGPRQIVPMEWSMVKRILDGRKQMILADGGLEIQPRAAARNAAHCVLLALDHPAAAAGQIYNVAEDEQFTYRQILELIAAHMNSDIAMVSMPYQLATPARSLSPMQNSASHLIVDTTKARTQLGYKDIISPRDALRQMVDWLIENPVSPENFDRDAFDYAAEDRLISTYREACTAIEESAQFTLPSASHAYPHPKEPSLQRDHRGR